jgi:UDP-N-acetyl-D-mannosaminuronate dehydrogenase
METTNMKIGIIGTGEVGLAIKKIVEKKYKVFTRDRKNDLIKGQKIEVLHICIPYTDEFIKIVVIAIKEYKPALTIIESTVAPGTTDKIYKLTRTLICHSPIRGIHPNLYKGIMTFVKYIGPTSKAAGKKTQAYYKKLGLKTEIFKDSKATEIAKLMDTTYYGWNIIFQKEMYKICRKNKIPFEQVYEKWNKTYNEGYTKLKMAHVVRPVLKNYPGKIGGHCIISNCEILEKTLRDPISKTVLNQNKSYK